VTISGQSSKGPPGSAAVPRRGLTLIEVVLTIGLLVVLFGLIMPNLIGDLEGRRLPESAQRMRALITLVRSHAMLDGKRYRIRFPNADEMDDLGGDRQPLIEREDNPLSEPEVYNAVDDFWVRGETLLGEVRCVLVRLGRPTLELIRSYDERVEMEEERFEDEDPDFPSLIFLPDGSCEWATFVLTNEPEPATAADLDDDANVIEVILDGTTGQVFLQRRFYEEELDLLEENGWPPVLRTDFMRPEALTEQDVLEIRDKVIRQS
jgi:hypothetical protein